MPAFCVDAMRVCTNLHCASSVHEKLLLRMHMRASLFFTTLSQFTGRHISTSACSDMTVCIHAEFRGFAYLNLLLFSYTSVVRLFSAC